MSGLELEMTLRHGYAWREKTADEILRVWAALPWYKRVFWTLRGKKPGSREELIQQLGG